MIDQLAKEIFAKLPQSPEALSELKQDGEAKVRTLLESSLRKLNLVSREEFDAQQAVLERTREKVDALEQQLAQLEQALQNSQKQS
ncbi:accessory factor UbiK family protein [Agaribacterium haliotis]|uniref:accessory factor UbiK family protein n=1 Tax=Agaribacterium haliotis TaxID=2013869 RepID=UPI000BB571CF|nr:accessory factor UbiK family protein [Agaribacterium haliotis]